MTSAAATPRVYSCRNGSLAKLRVITTKNARPPAPRIIGAVNAAIPAKAAVPGGNPYPAGHAFNVTQARLTIAGVDESQPVAEGAVDVTFRVSLPAGKTRLQTWFTEADGESFGAYYVYVRRL